MVPSDDRKGRVSDPSDRRRVKDEVTPVRLPPDVAALDIVKLEGIASGAYVLDDLFQPQENDVVQPLPKLEKPPVTLPVPMAPDASDRRGADSRA